MKTPEQNTSEKIDMLINGSKLSHWELFNKVTGSFNCVIIVGAGNHCASTPTVSQIAQKDLDVERFKIIRPPDYKIIEDNDFSDLLREFCFL